MDKICIVKRRKVGFGSSTALQAELEVQSPVDGLTIPLTQEQMDTVRSTNGFKEIYGISQAPIYLTLHLEAPTLSKMLKIEQICDMLQISKTTLAKLVKTGVLKSLKIGKLRRFSSDDVMKYLANDIQDSGCLRSIRRPTFIRTPDRGV